MPEGRITPLSALGLGKGAQTDVQRGMQRIRLEDGREAVIPLDGIGHPEDPERGMFLAITRNEASAALNAPLGQPLGPGETAVVYDATQR